MSTGHLNTWTRGFCLTVTSFNSLIVENVQSSLYVSEMMCHHITQDLKEVQYSVMGTLTKLVFSPRILEGKVQGGEVQKVQEIVFHGSPRFAKSLGVHFPPQTLRRLSNFFPSSRPKYPSVTKEHHITQVPPNTVTTTLFSSSLFSIPMTSLKSLNSKHRKRALNN